MTRAPRPPNGRVQRYAATLHEYRVTISEHYIYTPWG
jgi:hypothetical protein